MNFAAIIKEIGRGTKGAKPMDFATAKEVFGHILDGTLPELELGAILLSLRIKGEDPAELAGFKAALDARTTQIALPAGPRCVIFPTYNGGRKQANLMPLVAMLLAQRGVPVLIQGRHDFETRVSPFELLAALDIQTSGSLAHAEAGLASDKIACLPLNLLSPGLDQLLNLRQRLGVRNSGHTLAKLIDPCRGHSVRVVAVTHPPYIVSMQALLSREEATALLMRGTEGEAYASPRRQPQILGFKGGQTQVMFEQAHQDDFEAPEQGCSVAENVELIRLILAGQAPLPTSIANQVTALTELAQNA